MATSAQKGGIALEHLQTLAHDVWGGGMTEKLAETHADDIVAHDGPDTYEGREAYTAWVESYRAAMPDMHVEMLEVFGTDEFACGVFRITGTNTGPIPELDLDPTGKEVDITGVGIIRCADGKVVEEWSLSDDAEMMAQLGLMEPAPTA